MVLRSGREPLYLFEKCKKKGIFTVSSNVHVGLYGVLGQLALSGPTQALRSKFEGGSRCQGCWRCCRSAAAGAGSLRDTAETNGGLLLRARCEHSTSVPCQLTEARVSQDPKGCSQDPPPKQVFTGSKVATRCSQDPCATQGCLKIHHHHRVLTRSKHKHGTSQDPPFHLTLSEIHSGK